MAEELLNVTETPVTVDAQTAEDRGDNFTPTDDEPVTVETQSEAPPAPAPAAEAPAEPEQQEADRQQMIPKARLNEVISERNAARERIAELEREVEQRRQAPTTTPAPPAQPEFDVAEQEQAYAEALLGGDRARAGAIRAQINAYLVSTASEAAETRITQRQGAELLQQAAAQAEADYPFLNEPAGATALTIIIATRDAYIQGGMAAHKALAKAVGEIAPKFAPAASPTKDLPSTTPQKDTRTAAAVARGAAD